MALMAWMEWHDWDEMGLDWMDRRNVMEGMG